MGGEPAAVDQTRRLKILVIDDNPDDLELMSEVIKEDYPRAEVKTTSDVMNALMLSADVDLIVTDDRMPGMTGTELVGLLRRTGSTVPVIMTSAYLRTFDAFVTKDRIVQLPELIAEVLRLREEHES